MKILVTGGAGFIGSHFCEFLLSQGQQVIAIDNLITGQLSNLDSFINHPDFEFIQADVKDASVLEKAFSISNFVVHLAAPVGVKFIMNHPVHTILDAVHTTESVLNLAVKYNIPVLLASTSEVYGKNLDLLDPTGKRTLSEMDYRVEGYSRNHRWAYANVKSLNEFLAFAYMREQGLKLLITRFFNTAGARQRSEYGMVIPNFVQAALKGEPLKIYGDGKQRRSFIHIQDTISAMWLLMQSPNAFGEVYNIGNPEEITILQLAEKIIHLTHSPSQLEFMSYESAYGEGFEEMDRRTACIDKLTAAVPFQLTGNLDSILAEVIAFEKTRLDL